MMNDIEQCNEFLFACNDNEKKGVGGKAGTRGCLENIHIRRRKLPFIARTVLHPHALSREAIRKAYTRAQHARDGEERR